MFAHRVVSWIVEQSSCMVSVNIAGFPVLDWAIGDGFLMLLLAFTKSYTPHMPKICMPTFGNGLNNTKNCMHLPLSCPISNMYWIPGAIFSAVNKLHAGILPDCGRLAEKLALVVLRLFHRPLLSWIWHIWLSWRTWLTYKYKFRVLW